MVMPLYDDNSDVRIFPIVNIVIIAINILVFVFLQGMGSNQKFTMAYSAVPAEIASGKDIVTKPEVRIVDTPEGRVQVEVPGLEPTPIPVYLTLLSSMFMHGSIMHIVGNMWFLWIFGDNIEQDLGRLRYALFYVICGVAAALAHVLLTMHGNSAQTPMLGASGAISGVMGGYLVLHTNRRVTVLLLRIIMDVPAYVAVGMWFGFQLLSGLAMLGGQEDGVAYAAHIGGFVAGLALAPAFTIGRPRPERQPSGAPQYGGQ
jgi:membrane associated rhomboid family serine protease